MKQKKEPTRNRRLPETFIQRVEARATRHKRTFQGELEMILEDVEIAEMTDEKAAQDLQKVITYKK